MRRTSGSTLDAACRLASGRRGLCVHHARDQPAARFQARLGVGDRSSHQAYGLKNARAGPDARDISRNIAALSAMRRREGPQWGSNSDHAGFPGAGCAFLPILTYFNRLSKCRESVRGSEYPGFDEKWVGDRITDDPAILGLGDLILLDRERRQERAGRLDLLLEDDGGDQRYE